MRNSYKLYVSISLVVGANALAGCVSDDFLALQVAPGAPALEATAADAPAPIRSKMPWQLTPASTSSIAQGEKTIIFASARFGKVKGTPIAVANLEKPLFAYATRGPIVLACRNSIEPQARAIGAYSVQAAAAGPVHRDASGKQTQQVFFRVIYDRPAYLEVRQSALMCVIDAQGRIVDAHPV